MSKKIKSSVLKIYNCSKQTIPIQVRPPGSDFYTSEQQVRIKSGDQATFIKSHVLLEQIENLQKKRMIKVIYDSDTHND